METSPARPIATPRAWTWAALAALIALVPLTPGLSGTRIFYIRDLSLYFWGRYLWLRHEWQAGGFPLWDPYVGAGQSAVADAMHQMFLLPSVLLRLVGGDVFGFNLWVAAPFPLAALGTWLFLRRRFSPAASTLAAVAFALCGPVYSTSNFPNMSWTVATMPWILWAVDRVLDAPRVRRLGVLALLVAMQAFAGEPVTFVSTLLLAAPYAWVLGGAPGGSIRDRGRRTAWVAAGIALGLAVAAVQLVPMAQAAAASDRANLAHDPLFWSLHPLALLETVAPHLFGDYFVNQSLATIPWVPVINSGREPFFFSLYVGVPLLALAACGVAAGASRRWTLFWLSTMAVAMIGAFGTYTPIYPFLREYVPVLKSFRFPAKYIVIAAMGLAAATAAGWDALWHAAPRDAATHGEGADHAAARRRGRTGALVVAAGVGGIALTGIVACVLWPEPTIFAFFAVAKALRSGDPIGAAEYLLTALPDHANVVLALCLAMAVLMTLATANGRVSRWAQATIYATIVLDLIVRAWPMNPVFDPAYVREPVWVAHTAADTDARFYIGGKRDGTLDSTDPDASPGFLNPPGLMGSASRAALSGQTAFHPSGWRRREMFSYDLSVLWPRAYYDASKRFIDGTPDERDRYLRRTGVRYRILPSALAGPRPRIVQMPYYVESFLFDWGSDHAPRAAVVSSATVEPSVERQIEALFAPEWNPDRVLVTAEPPAAGRSDASTAGHEEAPAMPVARIVEDTSDRVRVVAHTSASGGYLVLLDSYAEGWQADVDGVPAEVVRANGLFRAVHLRPGRHVVDFRYRPPAVVRAALLSGIALLGVLGCVAWPAGSRRRVAAVAGDTLVSATR